MIVKVAAFILPLGLDTLAISIALGMRGVKPLRPAIVFAVFEGAMPLAGVLAGTLLSNALQNFAEYVGGVVLIGLGVRAMREAGEVVEEAERLTFTTLRTMMLAGVAVSLDEIAVGLPLATEHLPIVWVLVAIAVQAFTFGYIGVLFGSNLGAKFSRRAGLLAGAAFMLFGLWLVVSHALAQVSA